jgi:hypothetical protein
MVSSLAPDGASLNFSSRLGGSDSSGHAVDTRPWALILDAAGGVYVSGMTQSAYLPVAPGALHAVFLVIPIITSS